jgi:hypothetical protein
MPLVTLVKLDVRRVPTEELFTVTTFPTVPVMLQVSIVWPAEKVRVWATVLVDANSVKEFALDIDVIDIPVAPPIVSLLYSSPPPLNSLEPVVVLENKMFAVSLFNVVLAPVNSHTTFVPLNVHSPEPIVIVLANPELDVNVVQVQL